LQIDRASADAVEISLSIDKKNWIQFAYTIALNGTF